MPEKVVFIGSHIDRGIKVINQVTFNDDVPKWKKPPTLEDKFILEKAIESIPNESVCPPTQSDQISPS